MIRCNRLAPTGQVMPGCIAAAGQHGTTNERLQPSQHWERWGSWRRMPILPDMQDITPEPVRQRDDDSGRTTTSLELTNAPAHRPEDLCLHVCDGVRIVSDELQWIIQTERGKANAKSSGWKPRGFCRSRVGLRLVLRDLLGKAATEDDIAKLVDAFPEFHHIWMAGLDAPSPQRQA